MKRGFVSLVGAGPGDAGLITARGLERIRAADVIVYDHLVNPDLLRQVRADAKIIYAGKQAGRHQQTQEQINAALVKYARAGKHVVRLKGGDPFVFGRGGEEAERLAATKIPFEIVPGVTSAIAAPAYAGIPVTHRQFASAVTFVTGHEDTTRRPWCGVDWAEMAKMRTTLVILMGVGQLRDIARQLIAGGRAPATPTAVVQWGTTPRQRTVVAPLAKIADEAARQKISPPAAIVVGDVVRLRKKLNWYESRPLFGKRIVVTRAREQAGELSKKLRALGAEVIELPTIQILPPREAAPLRKAAREAARYDWIVFTSANGVDAFFRHVRDVRLLGKVKIAVIGPATGARVRARGLRVDLQPKKFVAEELLRALARRGVRAKRILLARADLAREALTAGLRRLGAKVTDVAAYRTVRAKDGESLHRLIVGGADWITFTSASTVENFCAAVNRKRLLKKYPQIRFASIGPITSRAARARGLNISAEAKRSTLEGLIAALRRACARGRRGSKFQHRA